MKANRSSSLLSVLRKPHFHKQKQAAMSKTVSCHKKPKRTIEVLRKDTVQYDVMATLITLVTSNVIHCYEVGLIGCLGPSGKGNGTKKFYTRP